MTASVVTADDLPWAFEVLAERRSSLVDRAPIFWRPAPDAATVHRAYVEHLLEAGDARAWRTGTSLLIAGRRGEGWLVDDAVVGNDTLGEGRALWNAFATGQQGCHVRFVCPTSETDRAAYAASAGLAVAESWWLRELPGCGGGEAGVRVTLPGSEAITVGAPPVYAPPGPMLFLPRPGGDPSLVDAALAAALVEAPGLGCAGVVVNQMGSDELSGPLTTHGFRRHCDFYEGPLRPL